MIKSACVFCASSRKVEDKYFSITKEVGKYLAEKGIEAVYGGGKVGLMGTLADSVLAGGGKIKGIIPRFMYDLGWCHEQISEVIITDNMHKRTEIMERESDVFITLPGGCGTFHEFLEAVTWKRLGLHNKPVVLLNLDNYYDGLIEQFKVSIDADFMDERHSEMFDVAKTINELDNILSNPTVWHDNPIEFANI